MEDYESNTSTINKKLEISVKTCPVNNVTIFVDRAEVNRLVDLDLEKENVEILLKDLPEHIDPDSIRYINIINLIINSVDIYNTFLLLNYTMISCLLCAISTKGAK